MHIPIILDLLMNGCRVVALAAALLCVGCGVATKTHVVVVPPPPVATDPTEGYTYGNFTFWYSPDQRDILDYLEKPRTFVNIDGKLVEYTECVKAAQHEPFGRWTDYKLIGTTQSYCKPF